MDPWKFTLLMKKMARENETMADLIFGMPEEGVWCVCVNVMPHMKIYQGLGDWVLFVEGEGSDPREACGAAFEKLDKARKQRGYWLAVDANDI